VTRVTVVALWVVVAGGCRGQASRAGVELTLLDGSGTSGEYHRVPALIDRRRSQYGASGLYVLLRLRRLSGAAVEVELDVPVGRVAPDGQAPPPRASYLERIGGRTVFSAGRVTGRIEVSEDAGCRCQTGRLELLFSAPGPDGALGTPDDETRRISRARLRRDARPFCHAAEELPIRDDVLVVGMRACPGGGGVGVAWGWTAGGTWSVDGWNVGGWYDEGWCGSSTDDVEDPWTGWEEGWTDPGWTVEGGVWVEEDCGACDDGSGWVDDGSGWSEGSGGEDSSDEESGWDSWDSGDSGDSGDSWDSGDDP
jgi:hypothetical protein